MKKYIIVDIGTSSLRVILMNGQMKILGEEVLRRVADVTFDAGEEWKNILKLVKSITRYEKKIDGIVVSSLLSWVGMDSSENAITPCYTYMHQCIDEYTHFRKHFSDTEVYQICKRRISAENAIFKIMYLKEREVVVYKKLACFTTLKDFINTKLTGVMGIDHTFACYTLLYDVEKACWNERLIRAAEIDPCKLPVLRRPYELLGYVKREVLQELGLEGDIPVAVGSVDGSTGILGAGAKEPGTAVSVMGTTDVFFMVHDTICDDPEMNLVTNPHVVPGLWISGGPMGLYGGTLEWFRKNIMGGCRDIQELNHAAGKIPAGSGGVYFFPTLMGERTPFWNPHFRGTVLGMSMEHQAAHLFRAILEADGYAVRKIAENGHNCGIEFDRVIALGGGSRSPLWLQIKTDIMGKVHDKAAMEEATAAGACMLLMLAVGIKAEELPIILPERSFFVQQKEAEKYKIFYQHYMKIHEILTELYEEEG